MGLALVCNNCGNSREDNTSPCGNPCKSNVTDKVKLPQCANCKMYLTPENSSRLNLGGYKHIGCPAEPRIKTLNQLAESIASAVLRAYHGNNEQFSVMNINDNRKNAVKAAKATLLRIIKESINEDKINNHNNDEYNHYYNELGGG